MHNILNIALRNLMRYRRRTILTSLLITIGVAAVLLFVAVAGSFKSMMIGEITDSMLGSIQIHHRGYVAAIDNLPLNLNMTARHSEKAIEELKKIKEIEAFSPRVKFGAMFSNFAETTNIRLNGVDQAMEAKTCPALGSRLLEGDISSGLINRGKILIPQLLAKGMKVKVGDSIVIVATNKEGSVNGRTFLVQGILESAMGPGGRDGYINIEDARELLRMETPEVTEIAVKLRHFEEISIVEKSTRESLNQIIGPTGLPALEVHTWEQLTPFASIAKMVDILTLFVKIMLVAIVLTSVMNVMIMAVYERIREIGTIAAIGTPPRRILMMFLSEGFLLGILGITLGTITSLLIVLLMNIYKLRFSFGMRDNIILAPSISLTSIVGVWGVVLLVAIIASIQPAWKAAQMDPNSALRHL